MRILFLSRSLERGGAERQLVAIANGLATRGHAVAIALLYPGGSLEHNLDGVEVIQLHKVGRWDIIPFCYRLVSAVKAWRPDVFYSFLGIQNILAGILKVFWIKSKIVWSVRASDMDYSYYDVLSQFANWVEGRTAFLADLIIANSQAGLEHAVLRGMPRKRIVVVPNGIDTQKFIPDQSEGESLRERWQVPVNFTLIGLVGRIDPMKDYETFLRAARIVSDSNSDIRFVCVGGGDETYAKKMKVLSESLELSELLTWAGELSCMNSVYNALDVCCLSSVTEGFPNVLGEAMSCGVPCVTTNVGDAARIVGESGLVVPKGSPEQLATALLDMTTRVRSGRGGNPRQRVIENFSLLSMIEQTESVLRNGV